MTSVICLINKTQKTPSLRKTKPDPTNPSPTNREADCLVHSVPGCKRGSANRSLTTPCSDWTGLCFSRGRSPGTKTTQASKRPRSL